MIRFRQKREEAGLNQKQAAASLKGMGWAVTASDLSKIENGHLLPTPTGAETMCEAYGTTMAGLARYRRCHLSPCKAPKSGEAQKGQKYTQIRR